MSNELKIQEIVGKNPRLDLAQLRKILKVVEEAKRLGIKPPGYGLATPMTPRLRPPVDHDNRMAAIESRQSR